MSRATIVQAIRRPASAAIAGLIFGVILGGVILLLQSASPERVLDTASWADEPSRVEAVNQALNLIPFAGIAFLWFIAVIRAQLGSREDRFFETVFLGSGLLFVALLFTAAAALKSVLTLRDAGFAVSDELLASAWAFAAMLLEGLRCPDGGGVHDLGDDHGHASRHHSSLARPDRLPGRRHPPAHAAHPHCGPAAVPGLDHPVEPAHPDQT